MEVAFVKNSARASAASTPMVFPPKWTSSMMIGSTSFIQGSKSALVSSFRDFPWIDRTLDIVDVIKVVQLICAV